MCMCILLYAVTNTKQQRNTDASCTDPLSIRPRLYASQLVLDSVPHLLLYLVERQALTR